MKAWLAVASSVVAGFAASAVADNDHRHNDRKRVFRAQLSSYNEVPTLSTAARGQFYAILNQKGDELRYWLSFSELSGDVTQSHIHFGQHHTNGGIVVWLCQGLPPAPQAPTASTPACGGPRTTTGPVTGVLTAAEVLAIPAQSIAASDFAELLAAMRAGAAYVNVHSAEFGPGEIRGQVE